MDHDFEKAPAEVGMWWGLPMTAEECGSTRWLEGTEFDTALGIRFGKNTGSHV